MEVPQIKFCKRCGRRLRSEESQERGYGKSCYKKRSSAVKPLLTLIENTVDKVQAL